MYVYVVMQLRRIPIDADHAEWVESFYNVYTQLEPVQELIKSSNSCSISYRHIVTQLIGYEDAIYK